MSREVPVRRKRMMRTGLDHSYRILVPARNVTRTPLELTERAPSAHRVPPLTVTLPGGDRIVVPFTSCFKSEPVDCSTADSLSLDTSIMFGVDEAVREYHDGDVEPDELGRVQIGYIHLTVRFAPEPPALRVAGLHGGHVGDEPAVRTIRERQNRVHRPHRRRRRSVLSARHRERHLPNMPAERSAGPGHGSRPPFRRLPLPRGKLARTPTSFRDVTGHERSPPEQGTADSSGRPRRERKPAPGVRQCPAAERRA